MLRKVKPYVPQATLQMMYKSFVLPYFNYCSNIWYDGNKMHAEKMLKLQKRAARVTTSYPGSFHYAPRWRKDPGPGWSRVSQILGDNNIFT